MRNGGVFPTTVGSMGWSRRMLVPLRRLVTNSSPAAPALFCVRHERQVTPYERLAAGSALRSFLRDRKGLKVAEASAVQRACPMFAAKLALLAKDNASAASSDWNDIKGSSTLLLQEQRVNVAEAVLESLGGGQVWAEESLAWLDTSDQTIRNVLDVVEVLHGVGFVRKKMWRLFQCNSHLWSSSPVEVEASIVELRNLGMGKELTKVITCCPLLIGRGSQEVRNGLVSTLGELEVDQKQLFNFLSLFQKTGRDSLQPVTEILEEHGVARDHVRGLLSLNALQLVAVVNPFIGSIIRWFSDHGIDEKLSWKVVILNHPVFCRSTNALEEQLSMLTEFGLSQLEVFELITKHSQCLVWNNATLQPKLEYLTKSMRYPAQVLLSCPRYLKCSLDCKIKPRHELVEWLEKQGKTKKPSTPSYLSLSEDAFLSAYGKLHSGAIQFYKNKQSEYSNPCKEKDFEGSGVFRETAEVERPVVEQELTGNDIVPGVLCSTEGDQAVAGYVVSSIDREARLSEGQKTEACFLEFVGSNCSTDVAEIRIPEDHRTLKALDPSDTGGTSLAEEQGVGGEEVAAAGSHSNANLRPAASSQQELITSPEVHVISSSEQVVGSQRSEAGNYEEVARSFHPRPSTWITGDQVAEPSHEDSTDRSATSSEAEVNSLSKRTSTSVLRGLPAQTAVGTSATLADAASSVACEKRSVTPRSGSTDTSASSVADDDDYEQGAGVNKRSDVQEPGILGFFRKLFTGFSN